jgi:hypothetical protein
MSPMSQQLLTMAGNRDGRAAQPTQERPGASKTTPPRALLEKPAARKRSPIGAAFFSPRALLNLTRRNFAIKLVSPKRTLFYFAVPIILALVTLSLRTADFPDDDAMAQKRQDIAQQIHGGYADLNDPVKQLLAPDGLKDPRPAEDVVFALKHEGLPNLPTPLSVLLMFVMTSVFMGTLMACLDLSTERPIYIRERMANQKITDYLASKLPFLLAATALQCLLFLALCRVKPGLRFFDFPSAALAMIAMAWASCAMGLFLSAADPSPGRLSVIFAIVAVLPQLVFSGGLGPDFYQGMSPVMKIFANLFPARWGLEMLITAFYDHPQRAALAWIAGFVPGTIGFEFGPAIYLKDTAILALQAAVWLILCGAALKRLDRRR